MHKKPHDGALAGSLFLACVFFGANNAGIKYIVKFWPPLAVGTSRFFIAGFVLLALLHWTKSFGVQHPITPELNRHLWFRNGLAMAAYVFAFNFALKLAPISHVALYLGTPPVWALLWEGKPERNWRSAQRYGAAALALCGVFILFWPVLRGKTGGLTGELLGLAAAISWTAVGRQGRRLVDKLSGLEISAHTFWRSSVWLTPLAIWEVCTQKIVWRPELPWIHLYCAVGGGVIPFTLWNNALRHWKTSQVYLFNNLIPITTMAWAHFCLNEPITSTFWEAMLLIGSGVLLGQANLQKIFGASWFPNE